MGNLNYSLDLKVLKYLLEKNPEKNFILIGKPQPFIKKGKKILNYEKRYSNLKLLGHRPNYLVPLYLSDMDILFSFKSPKLTRGNDSLKIYEYLAIGKPIITTPISPAQNFNDFISIAQNKFEFNQYLNKSLKEKENYKSIDKSKLVKHTWENRVDFIMKKIKENIFTDLQKS